MALLTLSAANIRAQGTALNASSPSIKRDRQAEQELTSALVVTIGRQAGRVPIIVKPNDFDLQMTCNTAMDPNQRKNAEAYGLKIVRGQAADLPQLLESFAGSAQATKDEPGISLVVFRTSDSDGHIILTVGLSRVESRVNHVMGCLFTEDGCSDKTWQRSITPACKGFRR
jgi:hypothetical protein